MAPIELVPAELAGTVVETLLFGVFLVTFAMCMHVLFSLRYRQTSKLSVLISPMTIAALFLFASIVSYWILVIVRLFDAFIYGQNGNPLLFFANIRDGKNVVKTALYIAQALCADMIMVYRLFHVSSRSWAISVFPIATIISTAISGAGVTYQFVHLKPGTDIFNSECGRWIATAFSSTLLTNIYSTSLIAYRTWKAHNLVKSCRHGPSAMTVVHVIVESAAIYTACTLVTFVAYLAHSDLQFPSLDASSPVIGIVFCLIIVRIRLFGHTRFQAAGNSTFRSIPAGGVTSRTDGDGIKMVKTLRHSRTEPLVVSVHREVEVDISGEWMSVDTPAEKTEHESFS